MSTLMPRRRATQAEMAERAAFFIDYARRHGPITVRGLYYQAEVAGLPGIDKSESGYRKTQNQILKLRQDGLLGYDTITDATRSVRRPATYDGWKEALEITAKYYRKELWADQPIQVELWLEKNALAGVVYPVTSRYDVPLCCTSGYCSESYAWQAVQRFRHSGKTLVVLALYDFDRSGSDAAASLERKLKRFGREYDVEVEFRLLGLKAEQVDELGLPTRPAKRKSPADRRWAWPHAAELDAIPPGTLRDLVCEGIEEYMPPERYEALLAEEAEERAALQRLLGEAA